MSTCFIIQPFDSGPFDRRYREVLEPAVQEVGLDPYRVDEDPAVNIPIDSIEKGIRDSIICIADITLDNPNVWFEIGFAIAIRKKVILICSAERGERFPFDVQHRHIIRYSTESPGDFTDLRTEISCRLAEALKSLDRLETASSSIRKIEGLSQHELAALVSIAQNIDNPADAVGAYTVRQDMERVGFTKIAATLALGSLMRKGFTTYMTEQDFNGEPYTQYHLTDESLNWLTKNEHLLVLKDSSSATSGDYGDYGDEDIPF